jgi:hypothetical protein
MSVGMRSIRRTLTRPNVVPKTKRNRVILLRTRFKTLWISEIHVNLKIDADALNRRRRRFCVCNTMCHICARQRRQDAGECAYVYGICSVKNEIENNSNLTVCTSNPT